MSAESRVLGWCFMATVETATRIGFVGAGCAILSKALEYSIKTEQN